MSKNKFKDFDKTNFIIVLLISISIAILILSIYVSINISKPEKLIIVQPLTIVKTYDNNKVIYFESDYKKADQFSLNKEASLEMLSSQKDIYFVYLAHDKNNYRSFDDYLNKIKASNESLYGKASAELSAMTVSGRSGTTTSYSYNKEGTNIYIKVFIFEDDEGYQEFMMWGEKGNKKQIDRDLSQLKIQ